MKLVATLLVRDEIDVVASTIAFHLAQGVDFIIATDNGSVDGTAELLAAYQDQGTLELRHQPDQDYRQSEWVTAMARSAASEYGADWVLNIDADEFWVPKDRTRTLKEALTDVPAEFGVVRAERTDMEGFPGRDQVPWQRRLRWRNMHTVSERGKPLGPKACHRGDPEVHIPQGNHRAEGPALGPVLDSQPLDIYHVPRRSWEQYRTKIDNGGSSYANNKDLPENVGWHWRNDHKKLLDGTLEEAYRGQCLSWGKLIRGVRAGTLKRDRWLERELARVEALYPPPGS